MANPDHVEFMLQEGRAINGHETEKIDWNQVDAIDEDETEFEIGRLDLTAANLSDADLREVDLSGGLPQRSHKRRHQLGTWHGGPKKMSCKTERGNQTTDSPA